MTKASQFHPLTEEGAGQLEAPRRAHPVEHLLNAHDSLSIYAEETSCTFDEAIETLGRHHIHVGTDSEIGDVPDDQAQDVAVGVGWSHDGEQDHQVSPIEDRAAMSIEDEFERTITGIPGVMHLMKKGQDDGVLYVVFVDHDYDDAGFEASTAWTRFLDQHREAEGLIDLHLETMGDWVLSSYERRGFARIA